MIINNIYFIFLYFTFTFALPLLCIPISIIHNFLYYGLQLHYIGKPDYTIYISKIYLFTTGVKIKFLDSNIQLDKGFILSNHRSWNDFCIDPYFSNTSFMGRHLGTLCVLSSALLAMTERRYLSFNRNMSRNEVFSLIVKHMNKNGKYSKKMLYWPEGTRKSHNYLASIEDTKATIKPGLLHLRSFKTPP